MLGTIQASRPDQRLPCRSGSRCRSSFAPKRFPRCPSRSRCTRSSCTPRRWRRSICAAAWWRAAASAGPTVEEDYRTEVLGLMKAQMVKNAVIVPDGSKGGFILKRTVPTPDLLKAEVIKQYVTFMRGLLDITDNLEHGVVVHPERVRVLDDDDSYLVVAADKGTATFSDTANGVAEEYGYLARRRLRVRRECRVRPQGARDHRSRGVGVGEAPFPGTGDRHHVDAVHGRRRRRHVRRCVRQRDAPLAVHPARRRVRPPARLRRPRPRSQRELRGAPQAVRSSRVRPGTTTTARRCPRRARCSIARRRA